MKEQVREIAESLPDDATWDDVAYAVEFRRKVYRGLEDIKAGRVHSLEEVRRRLGLD